MLTFDLMHGDDVVTKMTIDEDDGKLVDAMPPERIDLMPVGTVVDGVVRSERLKSWWSARSIPVSRTGIRHLFEALDIDDSISLLVKSMGLSLTDHYWIRPQGSSIGWHDVNFYENEFSDDVGDLLFGKEVRSGTLDLSSPDNTSEGMLMKRWKIIGGRRCLIKAGEPPYRQEAYNEKAAFILASHMGIPHVRYDVAMYDGMICSICEGFVDERTEFVSAHQIFRSKVHDPGIPMYDHFVSCCSALGMDAVPFLDRMIVFDYLIGNTDRHMNNFGAVRDAETLEWLGFAPLFDSGTSMGCDLEAEDIASEAGLDCKTFSEYFPRQMGLVRDTGWIDTDEMRRGIDEVSNMFSSIPRYRQKGRDSAIAEFLRSRADDIEGWVRERATETR